MNQKYIDAGGGWGAPGSHIIRGIIRSKAIREYRRAQVLAAKRAKLRARAAALLARAARARVHGDELRARAAALLAQAKALR